MAAGERELILRARDVIAARITDDHPGWEVGHDMYGWYASRLDDGHTVRSSGPDGLRAMISAAPPFATGHLVATLRRAYPAWHIWQDGRGWWHARRRGNFRQEHYVGAPLYAVHEPEVALLRQRLEEQDPGRTGDANVPADSAARRAERPPA
jgi:hypothetical protein